MKRDNPIQNKSFELGLITIEIYKHLKAQKEFVLARQILRSGTSVGANVEEAIGGQSRKDFLMKITIAYKEARETAFWLRLLKSSGYLNDQLSNPALTLVNEVLRILGSIQKSTKSSLG